jgi:D-sedoheptulose 7-phosphate isomerase
MSYPGEHLDDLERALEALREQAPCIVRLGQMLATRLVAGGRLLAAGNGGSAAEAQHLTAELVGRFDRERRPFSAIALHADTSTLTAIANDYDYADVFARQVIAHAQPRDVLVLLTTSGRSANLVRAAHAARNAGVSVWAFTGAVPNPLASLADEVIAIPAPPATVQEIQLVAVHMLCGAFESALSIVELSSERRIS